MKLNKTKWFRDRLYEIYLYLGLDGFNIGFSIADIDFEIHLLNCREINHGDEE